MVIVSTNLLILNKMTVKLDHIYLSVKDMDRAVKFREDIFEMKVTHREDNTWADFDTGSS